MEDQAAKLQKPGEPPLWTADQLWRGVRGRFLRDTIDIAVCVIWHLSKKVANLESRVAQLEADKARGNFGPVTLIEDPVKKATLERADLDKRTLKES